ncbi:hypothetical protein PS3A_36280 [Pseudomonas sp. 3A(2025)]
MRLDRLSAGHVLHESAARVILGQKTVVFGLFNTRLVDQRLKLNMARILYGLSLCINDVADMG